MEHLIDPTVGLELNAFELCASPGLDGTDNQEIDAAARSPLRRLPC